jgi:hypothetical protein
VHVFAEDKITRKSIVYLTVHLYFYSWAMVWKSPSSKCIGLSY